MTFLLLALFPSVWTFAPFLFPQSLAKDQLPPAAQVRVQFQRDIWPILNQRCTKCHDRSVQMGGMRLDNRSVALSGGYSGPAIKPGNSSDSRLIHLVAGVEKDRVMPLEGEPLSREQVGLLRAWIDQGVEWPEEGLNSALDLSATSKHWAFAAPVRPKIPEVKNRLWVRNPIDAFILQRLDSKDILPSPEATRLTLIRRLSLDLLGLPPDPKEVDDFVNDGRSDAYERLVDRLLASPHYGEKWARHWLDLARYADSDGYGDRIRPHAWRYRQWVIEALNNNMPFDQFSVEQIAGDLLPQASIEQRVATGFHRNTMTNREAGIDREEFRTEQVIDRTATVGAVWLGLTIGCARCHDHKYDPISQREFYQLYAFFNQAIEVDIEAPLAGEIGPYVRHRPEYDRKRQELLAEYKVADLQAEWEEKTLKAATSPQTSDLIWVLSWKTIGWLFDGGQEILKLSPSHRTRKQQDRLTDHFISSYAQVVGEKRIKELRFKELNEKLNKLAKEYPALSEAQILAENPNPPKTHLLIRGDFRRPGIQVQPDTPLALPTLGSRSPRTRLGFAQWLVSTQNPLTARVTVNRMWQEFFGSGLVGSSDNFGIRGDKPTHTELLDWLATEFQVDWNVKRIHKLIVESSTYRQSSKARKELQIVDPQNSLLARQSRLRLPAELIRDVTLAVSGLLNPVIGGRSFGPPLPVGIEFGSESYWAASEGTDRYRRGLYALVRRTALYPQFMTFDAPDAQQTCTRRERSTTPLQALNLLNDPAFVEAAQGLALRVLREKPGHLGDRLEYAFRLCLTRGPSQAEKDDLKTYYQRNKSILEENPESRGKLFPADGIENVDPQEAAIWVGLSGVLLNLDEFITRE